jgi:hypothetical protein
MSDALVEEAWRFLRGHTTGEMQFDEHLRPLRYVLAPDGRLVAPVMVAMLAALETVLFVPQCVENALEMLVTLESFDEDGPHGSLTDRWRIYHGQPPDVRWSFFEIDTARFQGNVIDGPVLQRPNPLAGDEPALCRELNQLETDELRVLCLHAAAVEVSEPVVVGVDHEGFDVRRQFDVVRVQAPRPMPTAAEARQVLAEMRQAARSQATS